MSRKRQEAALDEYLAQLLRAPAAMANVQSHAVQELPRPSFAPKQPLHSLQKLLSEIVHTADATIGSSPTQAKAIPGSETIHSQTLVLNKLPTVALPRVAPEIAEPSTEMASAVAKPVVAAPAVAAKTRKKTVNAPSAIELGQAISEYREQLPAEFQTLLFRVAELKLALPLYLLGGILRRDKTITPLPGKPKWFMGLLQHEPENIQVINTAQYLLDDRYKGDTAAEYEYIIVIGDNWGLACNELCGTIDLPLDDVRWFSAAERRPWLAGMLRDEMCALLNTQALQLLLKHASKKAA